MSGLTGDDVADAGFRFLSCREISVGGTDAIGARLAHLVVGELGWELYVATAMLRSCGSGYVMVTLPKRYNPPVEGNCRLTYDLADTEQGGDLHVPEDHDGHAEDRGDGEDVYVLTSTLLDL